MQNLRGIPFLSPFKLPFSTKTLSSLLQSFFALFAIMLLDALSIACRALSIVPGGLRWSSPALLRKKKNLRATSTLGFDFEKQINYATWTNYFSGQRDKALAT